MKNASEYSMKGEMVWQYGNSRTVQAKDGQLRFEVKKAGLWVAGRARNCLPTIERVKAALSK